MFNRSQVQRGLKRQVRLDRLLAQIVDRCGHLSIDIALCLGIGMAIVCMVAAARALDDWLPLGI
jgi:hypothetical protein